MKQYNTFNVIINGNAYTFSVIGYDTKHVKDIRISISETLNIMKNHGDFDGKDWYDTIDKIIEDFWKRHIHLDYGYPTFGTFNLTE